jgi:hypothetical protein
MAIALGTNSGFVTTAPTDDPAGTLTYTIDGARVYTKHTSPSNAVKITQMGWYRASGTNAANWEIGLYADSSGVPGARLFVDNTNSNAASGWLTTTVDWTISASTDYWLAVQMDAHTGSSTIDRETTGGNGTDQLGGGTETTLPDPANMGAVSEPTGMLAIYALVETSATGGIRNPVRGPMSMRSPV